MYGVIFDLENLQKQLFKLKALSEEENFWSDNEKAKKVMVEISELDQSVKLISDFENKITQTKNDQLIGVRETFDGYNLISALHSFHSIKDENYKNILPPLTLLSEQKLKELIEKLNKLKFISKKNLAA